MCPSSTLHSVCLIMQRTLVEHVLAARQALAQEEHMNGTDTHALATTGFLLSLSTMDLHAKLLSRWH
jgi:hypothetical protein